MRGLLINGNPVELLPALDRGLQFGDGLFETLAVVEGRPCLWDAHLRRLKIGCERLGIPMPDPQLLRREADHLIQGQARAVLKLIVTRGCGGRGYRPPEHPQPNRVMLLAEWPDYPDLWQSRGVQVRLCHTRLGLNPDLACIKHLNRLEQVMARAEWDDPDVAEGLLCDIEDRVIEGTSSNLFLQQDGRLLTPRLDQCGVAGIMRGLIMQLADAMGQPVVEAHVRPEDLESAEALYLSNSLIGVWSVRQLADRNYATDPLHPVMAAALEAAYGA